MYHQLEIIFRFEDSVRRMLELTHNGKNCEPGSDNCYMHKQLLEFPNQLRFEMTGKDDPIIDTVLDANNNIVWDRHIILQELRIDNIKLNETYLSNWPVVHKNPNNETENTNYMGCNGTIVLDFDANSLLQWYMRTA